jgi:hypothetical protein
MEGNTMSTMTHYLCRRELLPIVEGALAAHGYRIEIARQTGANSTTALVMTRGLTTILLSDAADQALATIEIWGLGQSLAAQLLESLPVDIHRPSPIALRSRGGADGAAYMG